MLRGVKGIDRFSVYEGTSQILDKINIKHINTHTKTHLGFSLQSDLRAVLILKEQVLESFICENTQKE